jgi:uncharacterized protein (DUF849 family)
MDKLIITCAMTGGVTMPVQTPYLPLTPQQIADQAVQAAEAGAASVHIHARNPETGRPTPDLSTMRQIITSIKHRSNVIINITTGGGPGMKVEDRIKSVPEFKPELATCNMGSINFSIHPLLKRFKDSDYKYDWEKEYIAGSKSNIFPNTFTDLEYFCKTMVETNTQPECECYDTGHIYNIAYLIREKLLKPPIWLQFVTGVLGGIGSALEDVMSLKQTADRVIGVGNYKWSVIGAGYPHQFRVAAFSMMMGGHVRVGLEDNIFIARHVLAKNNAELVTKTVEIARELDREIATPDEAREILNLKGKEAVNF